VIGTPVTDVAGNPLGAVRDVYRAGGAEVFVVAGGPRGEFDVPAVRAFIRVFAPRRGEIVVDADALGLAPAHPAADAE
jgi:ribosomal 30S subunit maturation factor RimM